MNIKNKPILRYGNLVESGHTRLSQVKLPTDIEYLCIPLTKQSRRTFISAMVRQVVKDMRLGGDHLMYEVMESAIFALEKMAQDNK